MNEPRQRPITRTLEECREEAQEISFTEFVKRQYRDHPPDFTLKKDVANKYGVIYFLFMMFVQYRG